MSPLAQAALISGSIFGVVMLRGYGRRAFDRAAVLMPLGMVAGFGYGYLRHMPLHTSAELITYAAAIAIGLVFGGVATAATGVERDRTSGKVVTVTGPAFAAVWALAVVVRLAFVWALQDWTFARDHIGQLMLTHGIAVGAIAPFFLLWALAMVVSRMVALKIRSRSLPVAVVEQRLPLAA